MPARVPDDEREQIIAEFATGKSCRQIARDFGRAPRTVSKIAAEEGHDWERAQTKKATSVRRLYDRNGRIDLIELGLQKQRQMLDQADTPHKLQAWWIGVGIGIDKRREEDVTEQNVAQLDVIFRQVDRMADDYETTLEPETSMEHQPQ